MPKILSANLYMGIDPGKQGGLVVIDEYSNVIDMVETPAGDVDLYAWVFLFRNVRACMLEQVNSIPGDGHVGAFTFGETYGKLQMALCASEVPYTKIHSRTWQKSLSVPSKKPIETKRQHKEKLRLLAQRLFPKVALWKVPRSLGKQLAVCDALLLAEVCRRQYSRRS